MSTPSDFARPHVPDLHAYTPGTQPTDGSWIKLNTNECPYPPSPHVAAAIAREVGAEGSSLRLYPSPTSAPLRTQIAKLHGLTPAQVIVGNGSDDILNLLVRVFGGPTAPAGFTLPSYSLYPVLVAIQDGATAVIEFDRSMRLPVDRIAASGAKAFFLTSPNAPTGVGFSNAEISRVLNAFDGILVVDEAYAPFAEEDAIPLLAAHRNLVIVRTLSKAHALAGMRVGYALADPETIGLLDRVRDSYNVNRLSQVAAAAALADTPYYDAIIGKIKRTRDNWATEWAERDWFVYRSSANFLFVEPRNAAGEAGADVAAALFAWFKSRKILVRAFPSHALTASFLRISVGTDDEMLAVEEAIQAWLTNAP
ncbi:histidinol-phosphate transaminase [Synoicihabitans lomoniglobus]|uniref:Histidinol-phosphate aminotransferase n=1 Tax=Synoicihabitans lomoniglobus TaxID=2909285 RepID=A0AAF0CP60_9BACT|nr:histidinol-phosphate transaminase [Opitutaceae bacterium LMO-M01]WED65646.1 histidinol-phosphate transaminase [Opitutaceae bacterium LMO-M01]